MSDSLRVVYAGTPEFAVPALDAVAAAGHRVVAVYTQPDRRSGRGRKVVFSPVKAKAMELSVPVEQPLTLRDATARAQLQSYQPDVMIVAAYGLILPPEVLAMPRYGCLNIHASLLPRWRGAAPIQRAIEAGDEQTGVTIMQMAEGLDTGDMLVTRECPVAVDATAAVLHNQLAELGAAAMLETLVLLQAGELQPQVQDESLATYAHKLDKQEAVIDWQHSALTIHRRVCAFNPWPVAQTALQEETLRVWETQLLPNATVNNAAPGTVVATEAGIDVATGDGVLSLQKIQVPGKKPMPAGDFLNSRSIAIGTRLG
jgi:methionyl-tRNA formyltransferase